MKLSELLAELEQKGIKKPGFGALPLFDHKILKQFENRFYECEEFKDVVRINFLEMPTYLVDEETGEPIAGHRNYLGGNVKPQNVLNFQFSEGDEIKFGKIVDLYSIAVNKVYDVNFMNSSENRKYGVWNYPVVYDVKTFEPLKEIRVIWSPEQLRDALAITESKETVRERLIRMFEEALDRQEPNIPCSSKFLFRCSSRSIIGKSPAIEGEASPAPSYKGFSDTLE